MNTATPALAVATRRPIFGVPVYDLTWEAALAFVAELAALSVGQVNVSFLNANNANILHSDRRYREVLREHVVLPDGVGIDLASRVLNGRSFSANLNGTDFIPALLTYLDTPKRVGLLGGHPDVLKIATERFRRHAPWHTFIPVSDGYFSDKPLAEVLDHLASLDLDVLIVGMGTPLQEKWIAENIREDHARLVFGVGALFDFVSGRVPRAPDWIRRLRFEWAYRLLLEPGRLWRRYVLGIPVFAWRVLRWRLLGAGRSSADPARGATSRS